ncbi:MAG: DUF4372 domain-containing protein [Treponema sp.]|nr:DUF4372 domain-containing protein [Treponema sp.]
MFSLYTQQFLTALFMEVFLQIVLSCFIIAESLFAKLFAYSCHSFCQLKYAFPFTTVQDNNSITTFRGLLSFVSRPQFEALVKIVQANKHCNGLSACHQFLIMSYAQQESPADSEALRTCGTQIIPASIISEFIKTLKALHFNMQITRLLASCFKNFFTAFLEHSAPSAKRNS